MFLLRTAIGGFFFGLLLICIVPCVIAWNEVNYVYTVKMIKQVSKVLITVKDPENPNDEANRVDAEGGACTFNCSPPRDPKNDIVHVQGKISCGDYKKEILGVPIDGYAMWRSTVEIYQFVLDTEEVEDGPDRKTLKKKWVGSKASDVTDLDGVTVGDGNNASANWGLVSDAAGSGNASEGKKAKLGAYLIPDGLFKDNGGPRGANWVDMVNSSTVVPTLKPVAADGSTTEVSEVARETDSLNEPSSAKYYLTDATDLSAPKVGNVRVRITAALKDGENITVLAGESPSMGDRGGATEGAPLKSDEELEFVDIEVRGCGICTGDVVLSNNAGNETGGFWAMEVGHKSAPEVMANEAADAVFKLWVIRVACFIFMWIGFQLLLGPISAVFSAVPLLGNIVSAGVFLLACACTCVCCCTETAVIWLTVRPLMVATFIVGIWGFIYVLNHAAEGFAIDEDDGSFGDYEGDR